MRGRGRGWCATATYVADSLMREPPAPHSYQPERTRTLSVIVKMVEKTNMSNKPGNQLAIYS